MPRFHMLAIAGALAAAAPAAAQNVTASDPGSVEAVLREAGLTTEMGTTSKGNPRITAKWEGHGFSVFFYGCTDGAKCTSLGFNYGIDLQKPVPWSKMNAFNKDQLFTRTYFDAEFDPILEMDVDLDDGGLSREAFAAWVRRWIGGMTAFRTMAGL